MDIFYNIEKDIDNITTNNYKDLLTYLNSLKLFVQKVVDDKQLLNNTYENIIRLYLKSTDSDIKQLLNEVKYMGLEIKIDQQFNKLNNDDAKKIISSYIYSKIETYLLELESNIEILDKESIGEYIFEYICYLVQKIDYHFKNKMNAENKEKYNNLVKRINESRNLFLYRKLHNNIIKNNKIDIDELNKISNEHKL